MLIMKLFMSGVLLPHTTITTGIHTVQEDGYIHIPDGFGFRIITGVGLRIITADGISLYITAGYGFREEYGHRTGVCGDTTDTTLAGILTDQEFSGEISIIADITTALLKLTRKTGLSLKRKTSHAK